MKNKLFLFMILALVVIFLSGAASAQDDDSTRKILKEGLLGAGTGAIAAGASGGKAGQGALIGAGTGIIGGALLDAITGPPRSSQRRVAAAPPQDDYYYEDEGEAYYEEAPPQESSSNKILKQGLIGAGTGAIAAGTSGGKAGQGALIGAGTTVIGSALLDTLTQPAPQPRRVYRRPAARQIAPPRQNVQIRQEESATPEGGRKKVIKKYDSAGKLVSEEEIYY